MRCSVSVGDNLALMAMEFLGGGGGGGGEGEVVTIIDGLESRVEQMTFAAAVPLAGWHHQRHSTWIHRVFHSLLSDLRPWHFIFRIPFTVWRDPISSHRQARWPVMPAHDHSLLTLAIAFV
jgi:hypothetical protein